MANISFGLDTDKYAKERGFDKYQTTIGEVLGETAKDAWKYNPVSSLIRLSELETNRSENTGEPLIDRQELNDKYGKFNLFFDEDEKQSTVDIIVERKKAEINRQSIIQRGPEGRLSNLYLPTLAKFGTAMVTSIADPINLAMMFVPYVGQARFASLVARYGFTKARFAKGAIDQADAFGKLSRQTGIAADSLQAYVNAGKLAGVEQATIEKGLRRLAQSMREADQGVATYADAYKALGVSVRDSDGNLKESEVVLAQLADRFKEMPNGATKAALAMEIFGRSGAQLIPMLNEGGDALERWNYQTSANFSQNAEYFNDQITMLGFGFDGFRKQLADALLPTLNELVGVFQEIFDSENDWTGLFKVIEVAIRSVAFAIMGAIALAKELIEFAKATKDVIGNWLKGDFTGMDEVKADWRAGFAERIKEKKELFDSIIGGTENAPKEYFEEGEAAANDLKETVKDVREEMEKSFGENMNAKLVAFSKTLNDMGSMVGDTIVKAFKGAEDALVSVVKTGNLDFRSGVDSILSD